MPTTEELRALACQTIDQRAREITGIAQRILENPEPGFREQKTSRFVLKLPHRDGQAPTGIKAWAEAHLSDQAVLEGPFGPRSTHPLASGLRANICVTPNSLRALANCVGIPFVV